ncbi:phosphonate transport system permease protein [Desulfacinum infernum DSM 9756]|uniref:Phosphonate transport system permease protein n=1 Tax=Desulfacinum infernum DSM 9756 TaxID=1121391 RepID=A0A1M4XMY7_9BACT|nr:phosphonate ABC transporter, permease protein PhnE [Desulfacinum infernum]SHE94849.1 phosphonate transport system permease protein [Desulfacinum infernum DSM 9756]
MNLSDTQAALSRPTPWPAWNSLKKAMVAVTVLAVLAVTYVWTGINPVKLWERRENAWAYLFGRRLSQEELRDARRQAERMPLIVLTQEILQGIKEDARQRGVAEDPAAMYRRAQELAQERLESMSADRRETLVHEEFARIVDERRGGFFPPETGRGPLMSYTKALLETVAMAVWGSLLAIVWALPFSFLAARNSLEVLFPGDGALFRWARGSCQFVTRRLLDFCRGFNEFVMALVFVAVIGLGPFAGVMALAIHTFGILGKVFSEAIEAVEPGQVEAVAASGAGSLQVLSFAVLPQVMPLVVSYSLLRFESNVRSASILGFCGAGGIGFLMFDKLNGYQYREVATMMLLVIVSVTIIDYLCGALRRRFI